MFLRAILPFSFALLAQAVFVFLYLEHENAPPFWDYAMYATLATGLWAHGNWSDFANSFSQKYNLLFALPSLLSFSLFGASRTVFIVTNMVVYGTAYQLTTGFLLHRLYGLSWRPALLLSVGVCSLLPFLWYPLLQGYPDHGAAALLLVALALTCRKGLSQQKTINKKWEASLRWHDGWGQAFAIGLLIGLAIVFRRHYAYAGIAVLAASAFVDAPLWKTKSFWLSHALRGVAAFTTLLLVEPAYLKEMIAADYAALYRSYERPALYFFHFVAAHGGLLLLLLSGAGLAWAWHKNLLEKRGAGITLLAVFLWLLLWGLGPTQVGQHYLIALLPVVFIVGLAGFFVAMKNRRFVFWLGLGAMIANAAFCFWLAPRFVLPSEPPSFSAFGTPRPPWVRRDIPELTALAQYVAATTTGSDTIVVSGSSFLFNQDLVRALYTEVLHHDAPAYRFIPAPESDGDQEPPLDVYATANVYVVASPAQFHLAPARQKNVAALAALFPPPPALAPFFTKDEKTFALDGDVIVSIWRRAPWTPAALHAGLATIRTIAPAPRPWVLEKIGAAFTPLPAPAPFSAFRLVLTPQKASARLFLDEPLAAGSYRLGLTLEKAPLCEGLSLRAALQDSSGALQKEQSVSPPRSPALFFFPFTVDHDGGFLELEAKSPASSACFLALHSIFVEKTFR